MNSNNVWCICQAIFYGKSFTETFYETFVETAVWLVEGFTFDWVCHYLIVVGKAFNERSVPCECVVATKDVKTTHLPGDCLMNRRANNYRDTTTAVPKLGEKRRSHYVSGRFRVSRLSVAHPLGIGLVVAHFFV